MKSLLLFYIFVFFSLYSFCQHGIDSDWNQILSEIPKYNSSLNASGAVANNMVVDKNGRVIIFYTEEVGNQLLHYYVGSSDNGENWNDPSPTLFETSLISSGNSTISADIDTNDVIHVIWSSKITQSVYYTNANASDFLWSSPQIIGTTNKTKIGFCQISTDRKMRLHAYWNEGGPGTTDTSEVFYAQSLDNGNSWSSQLMLSQGENKHSAFPTGDFYGVTGDTLAIAWRDSIGPGTSVQDWDIKMVTSIDGGISWSNPFTVAGGVGMQSDPSIVIDKNNIIHMAFHEYPIPGGTLNSKVFYGYSTDLGQTWNSGSFTQISEPNIQSHLVKEAYDFENDIVWYFYKDQRDYITPLDKRADVMAIHSENEGQTISEPEFISDADSNEVGFHNFKIGKDGIPRAHFFIIPFETDSTTLFYTQRSPILGYEKILESENLIFQNPSCDLIYINIPQIEILKISIYNLEGKKMIESFSNEICISGLLNGTYIVDILTSKENLRKKIIKI